jgi:hypothetical protein
VWRLSGVVGGDAGQVVEDRRAVWWCNDGQEEYDTSCSV